MAKKSRKRIFIYVVLTILVLALISLALFFVSTVEQKAQMHLQKLDTELTILKKQMKALSKTTEAPLFDNPDLAYEEKVKAIAATTASLDKIKQQLAQVERVNKDTHPALTIYALSGEKIATIDKQLPFSISQSREVIGGYEKLLGYIKKRSELDRALSEKLQEFNAIADYDELAGRAAEFEVKRDETEALLAQLKALPPPEGLEGLHDQATQTYAQASAGFSRFASSLSLPVEAELDAAASDINETAKRHEVDNKYALFDMITKLPILEDVAQIDEKFDKY